MDNKALVTIICNEEIKGQIIKIFKRSPYCPFDNDPRRTSDGCLFKDCIECITKNIAFIDEEEVNDNE